MSAKLFVYGGPDEDSPQARYKIHYERGPMIPWKTVAVCTKKQWADELTYKANMHDQLVAALQTAKLELQACQSGGSAYEAVCAVLNLTEAHP